MATEIERKFLVTRTDFLQDKAGKIIQQGYVTIADHATTRVRIKGTQGYLTIKGATTGMTRSEFEYEIPTEDAKQMLDTLCGDVISKTRYKVDVDGMEWVVDLFDGDNEGLVLAEVELEDESQQVTVPDWAGQEVTHDHRYFNAYLSNHPFTTW